MLFTSPHLIRLLITFQSIADVVESILGALYVSDGFTLTGAQAMYENLLKPFYDQHISLKTLSHHPTKILFELFQSLGCQEFEITKQFDVEDPALFRCEGKEVHDLHKLTDVTLI